MKTFTLASLFVLVEICSYVQASLLRKTDTISNKEVASNVSINYKEQYFSVPVDHFGFANEDRFPLRYLINEDYWGGAGSPVFFYAGNEGDIELFCNNTGLMWAWAPEFKALIIFVEHRYYGKSLPYGDASYTNKEKLGYLSSEQALADFADVLLYLKSTKPGMKDSPIIAFGGSYGGMLAAWMRMKYPNVVEGALAASAPIWWFGDLTPCTAYYETVTNDFAKSGPNCVDNIKSSWGTINEMGATAEGRSNLKSNLKLCQDLNSVEDVEALKMWLMNTYGNLAMVDYPYAANFLEPLPAWPIKEVCKNLADENLEADTLIRQLAAAIGVYYNYTGGIQCFNTSEQAVSSLGDMGWDFQACTEMTMPMCTDGVHDMFEVTTWNLTYFAMDCKKRWGTTTRPDWAIKQYGGKDIASHTNIIFSNGALDPWSGGGVLSSLAPSLPAILIAEGAHHLDLRGPHVDDPPSVITAREQEKQIIQGWLNNYRKENFVETMFAKVYMKIESDPSVKEILAPRHMGGIVAGTVLCISVVLVVMILRRKNSSKVQYNVLYIEEKAPLL